MLDPRALDEHERALREGGAIVTNLRDPTDPAIRTALGRRVDTVVQHRHDRVVVDRPRAHRIAVIVNPPGGG